MLHPQTFPHLIEQFWGFRRGVLLDHFRVCIIHTVPKLYGNNYNVQDYAPTRCTSSRNFGCLLLVRTPLVVSNVTASSPPKPDIAAKKLREVKRETPGVSETMQNKSPLLLSVPHGVPCLTPSPVLTFSSSGRAETAHRFLKGSGPRRSTKR